MFDNLPLDEFGNRIPPITAEISFAGAPEAVVRDTPFLPGAAYFTNSAVLDSERGTWNNMSDPGAFAAAGVEEQEGGEPLPWSFA